MMKVGTPLRKKIPASASAHKRHRNRSLDELEDLDFEDINQLFERHINKSFDELEDRDFMDIDQLFKMSVSLAV
jgi:hypothetical protein